MSLNAAKKMDRVESKSIEKEVLQYMPHVQWLYSGYKYITMGLFALTVIGAIGFLLIGNLVIASVICAVGLYLSGIFFACSKFMLRPLAQSSVEVFDDCIQLNRIGKQEKVHFKNIQKIKIPHLKMKGGWFKLVLEDGKPARKFTVILRNGYKILDAIAKSNPSLISEEKLLNYKRTNVFCYYSWNRLYGKAKNGFEFILKFGLALTIFSYCLHSFQDLMMAKAIIYGIVISLVLLNIAYVVEEHLFGKELLKKWESEEINESTHIENSKELKTKTDLIFYASCIIGAILLVVI